MTGEGRPRVVTGGTISRENNFWLIRHAAAAAVIYAHAFPIAGGPDTVEPLYALTGMNCGDIAVDVFFVTSGYLVTQSLLSGGGSLVSFVVSRAVRIYPALITVSCLTAFIIGPLLSTWPFHDYFSSKAVFSYAVYNSASLLPYRFRYELPGVFVDNPLPHVVNGSLWSLSWEIWMYGILAALFAAGCLRRGLLIWLWSALICVFILSRFGVLELSPFAALGVRLQAFFFTGALFYRYREALRLTLIGQVLLTVVFVAGTAIVGNDWLLPLFLAHSVLFLAFYRPLLVSRVGKRADLSYGLYLYGYLIQQILALNLGPHNPYLNAVLALSLTLPVAMLSWFFIEKPVLERKKALIATAHTMGDRCRTALGLWAR